jgi:hypothetical protein
MNIELTGHQGEQVAGLGKWIMPGGPVATVVQVAAADAIAVGQQHRIANAVRDQSGGKHRHHVGTVEK